MKIIVTHTSPDWDAIGGVWLLRKYLPGWQTAAVEFVPAGQRRDKSIGHSAESIDDPIEIIGEDEVVHVDTGLGPLDHHQISDKSVSGTSRVWDYVRKEMASSKSQIEENEKWIDKEKAIDRIVKFIVDTDHFKEVFWDNPAADFHEFSVLGILEGLKLYKPDEDDYYVSFGIECLESLLRTFENRIWAEQEIEKSWKFETKWGTGLAFETINDTVLKLAQKMGYILVVRKDPRKGYVRIKARPTDEQQIANSKLQIEDKNIIARSEAMKKSQSSEDIDLTPVYEKLKKIDPEATWFLHVSRKMLLNGTPKNPKMVPTKLSISQIVDVIQSM